jgi:anthranilate/para-aminobenzoate synthase component I
VVEFFGRDGQSVFNIAIRTIIMRDGLGADSDPASEYVRTWPKAAGLFTALS